MTNHHDARRRTGTPEHSKARLRKVARLLDEVRLEAGRSLAASVSPQVDLDDAARTETSRLLAHLLVGATAPECIEGRESTRLVRALGEAGVEPGAEKLLASSHELTLTSHLEGGRQGYSLVQDGRRRRQSGSFFTPPAVATYLVDATLGPLTTGDGLAVSDPACGTGMFLLETLDFIANKGTSGRHLVAGVELNPTTAGLARLLLESRKRFLGLDSQVEVAIHVADALLSPLPGDGAEGFVWEEAFPGLFTRAPEGEWRGGFDAIVGNPPFLSEVRGNATLFSRLRVSPRVGQYYRHKMDLFYFFVALAIDLARDGGRVGLVVPNYWTDRSSAVGLRRKILGETRLDIYASFSGTVFRGAPGSHNGLMVLEKGATPLPSFELVHVEGTDPVTQGTSTRGVLLSRGESLQLLSRERARVLERLGCCGCLRLDPRACIQGVVAPQTRVDGQRGDPRAGTGVFVLNEREMKELGLEAREQALLRPYYWARQVQAYRLEEPPGGRLLYMDGPAVGALEESPDDYRRVRNHLWRHRGRITSSRRPFGLHRPREARWFEAVPKLIGVRKASFPRFCLVVHQAYVGESCLVLHQQQGFSLEYVLVLLNSTVGHYLLHHTKRHGRLLQVDQDALASFPIPPAPPGFEGPELAPIVTRLADDTTGLVRALDRVVYDVFRLSPADRTVIERETNQGARGGPPQVLPTARQALHRLRLVPCSYR